MEKNCLVSAVLVAMIGFASTSYAAEPPGKTLAPIRLTSVCFSISLNMWDKLDLNQEYPVTYVVQESGGRAFVASRLGRAQHPDASEVKFPRDFTDRQTGLPADADCHDGRDYRWTISAGDQVIDAGTFSFKRQELKRSGK